MNGYRVALFACLICLELRCVVVAVRGGHLVAGVVVYIGDGALHSAYIREVPGCVVGVGRGVTERVGLGCFAAGVVVGVAGGGGI